MKRKTLITTTILIALSLMPSASANHCPGDVIDVDGLYIWHHISADGNGSYLEVYLESNGQPGLQQGGSSVLDETGILSTTHPCGHAFPDTPLHDVLL